MSVPSSPQNEAIQHSSVSTSNGVSSSSAMSAPSSAATNTSSDHSTEESWPQRGAAQSQPSGSWLSQTETHCCLLNLTHTEDGIVSQILFTWLFILWLMHFVLCRQCFFFFFFNLKEENKGTLSVTWRCKPCSYEMFLYLCDLFIDLFLYLFL